MLPAGMEPKERLRANIMTVKKLGLITVFVVEQPYLAVRTSLIQEQAGHLSRCLLMMQLWEQRQIAVFSLFAQKYIVASVRLILAMYLKTDLWMQGALLHKFGIS